MDLNKLITKRIKEYALGGDVDLLDKYGFLFNMIAKDYAEAINYTHCCKSDSDLSKCDCAIPFVEVEDSKMICQRCGKVNQYAF